MQLSRKSTHGRLIVFSFSSPIDRFWDWKTVFAPLFAPSLPPGSFTECHKKSFTLIGRAEISYCLTNSIKGIYKYDSRCLLPSTIQQAPEGRNTVVTHLFPHSQFTLCPSFPWSQIMLDTPSMRRLMSKAILLYDHEHQHIGLLPLSSLFWQLLYTQHFRTMVHGECYNGLPPSRWHPTS